MVRGPERHEHIGHRQPAGQGCAAPETSAPELPEPGAPDSREIESSALFGGARTVAIRHGAELYTLRITRADKLILTK